MFFESENENFPSITTNYNITEKIQNQRKILHFFI